MNFHLQKEKYEKLVRGRLWRTWRNAKVDAYPLNPWAPLKTRKKPCFRTESETKEKPWRNLQNAVEIQSPRICPCATPSHQSSTFWKWSTLWRKGRSFEKKHFRAAGKNRDQNRARFGQFGGFWPTFAQCSREKWTPVNYTLLPDT